MSKEYVDLPERIKADFLNIDGDIVVDLRSTDSEYQSIYHRYAEMQKDYPFSGEVTMTAEEHTAFVEYMRLKRQLDDMERLHIYFRGHTDAFAYLKRIQAL